MGCSLAALPTSRPPLVLPASGMILHLRASEITGLADGDPVSTWSDLSGAAHDATASGSARPLYKTNIVNGKAVVRFDGTDDGMLSSAAITASAYTIAVVYAYNNTASAAHRVVQGSNNWLMGPYTNIHRLYSGVGFIDGPAVSQNVFVKSISYADPGAGSPAPVLRVNGTAYGPGSGASYPGTIGLGVSGAFAETADSDVAEVIAWNRILSAAELNDVDDIFTGLYAV